MNYMNYDKAIIQKHHIKLIGWPKNVKFVTPANLSSIDEVRTLRHVLKSNECRWVRLSQAEVDEHMATIVEREAAGEQVGRKRKQHSDKGKSRKKATNTEQQVNGSEGNQPSSQQPEEQVASRRSGRLARSGRTSKYKSKAVLSESGSDDSGSSFDEHS